MTTYKSEISTAARRITRTLNQCADYEIIFFDRDGQKITSMNRQDARWQEGRIDFDYDLALTPKSDGQKWSQTETQVWLDSLDQDEPAAWRNATFAELERRREQDRY